MNLAHSKLYKLLLAFLAVGLLFGVSAIQRQLNQARQELGLTRIEPLENAPPVLAFTTVALGGFRGLIANALWMRLYEMQQDDKFFEMVQLADWISKLQPHSSSVWVHLAWNMSYNISVKFTQAEDRWPWVLRGIELLRDQGLRYNPGEPLIYRELAWHFQHKMGHNLDDAHNYYKWAWAQEMQQALGAGRPNFEALLNPQTEEDQERVRVLREKYKLDPEWMKVVDERYGPLEWRLPETHAIYWAIVGLERTQHDKLKQEYLITLRRVIFQSMHLAFHRGRLVYPNPADYTAFDYAPNIEIVARTNQAYEEMIEQEPNMRDHLRTAHKNFLKSAVEFLYIYNRPNEAAKWFAFFSEQFPDEVSPGQTVDDFALARVTEHISETNVNQTKAIIEGLLIESFVSLAIGEDDYAISNERMAQHVRNWFMNEIGEGSAVRVGLPEMEEIKREILSQLLDPEYGLPTQLQLQLRSQLQLPADAFLPVPEEASRPGPDGASAAITRN
jgi:hypothetical protein